MPSPADVRQTLLTVIQEKVRGRAAGASLQQNDILPEVGRRLGISHQPDQQLPALVAWNDLFRTGYLGWGLSLDNPNPPFFHVTEWGRRALEQLSRDPGNPAGYLEHLSSVTTLNSVASSYLKEGLECFASGLHKSAAVMLGCVAESVTLEVRDATTNRMAALGLAVPRALADWKLKGVHNALYSQLASRKGAMPRDLREAFESFWPALVHQMRMVRNDAGHPASVDPVSSDTVHASFLLFPDLAGLAARLKQWVGTSLT